MNNFELENFINTLLSISDFDDYTINGLQVEGKKDIKKIVTGVTASQDLIDYAVEVNADAILVHHGYFWKGLDPRLVGYHYQRIKKLIKNDINLYAYHLPLDKHIELGNNRTIADFIKLKNLRYPDQKSLILLGELEHPTNVEDIKQLYSEVLGHEILLINENCPSYVTKIGICTGGGQSFIDQAYKLGCQLYISGEISEYTTHSAREQGINYLKIGHHASERYGVLALGNLLAQKFDLDVEFKDIYNPA